MKWNELPLDKKLYLFELDDVLYPKQDFLLQIYYLFGQFVEFNEGESLASSLTEFMKNILLEKGEDAVFEEVRKHFSFKEDYAENFERLQVNGHLPLKLLLYNEIKLLFASLIEQGKTIAVLTAGNPALQLNKLKHIDWQGLDKGIRVYFSDELLFRNIDPIPYIASENGVNPKDILYLKEKLTKL